LQTLDESPRNLVETQANPGRGATGPAILERRKMNSNRSSGEPQIDVASIIPVFPRGREASCDTFKRLSLVLLQAKSSIASGRRLQTCARLRGGVD
jgi:hypothetical protein